MILGKNFSNLKVILVEPNGPLNVGSVARLCSNFEVEELRIVSPKCDIFSLEAKKMALKGQKYLDKCKIFDDLQEAIFDCDLVLASCGRIDVSKDSFFEASEDVFNWTTTFKKINNLEIIFGVLLICFSIFFVNHHENNKYIIETLELNGLAEEGDALFKINCVGCHGISARGLVGPDLHSVTQRLNDKEIIKQVTGGLTPPMPSFEIDPINMSNLLKYLHSLE